MKKYLQTMRQKGAILILTALALPLFICGTGLAVDLGNIYIQKARLQNAADAAALAGANAYAKNNEVVSSHPKADAEAYEYILGDYHNLANDEDIAGTDYKAADGADSSTTIYGVRITKDVPLYFLKAFYDESTFRVSATSEASIVSINNINTPTNLFMFEKEFSATNSVNNPDKLTNDKFSTDSKNMLSNSFDGRIAYTDRYGKATKDSYGVDTGDVTIKYSTQAPTLDRFFTSKAVTDNQTKNISDIMASGQDAEFSDDGKLEDGYYHYAEFEAYDYEPFMTYVKDLTSTVASFNSQDLRTSDAAFASNYIKVEKSGSVTNLDINVDKTLDNPNNADEPVYIYVNTYSETYGAMGVVNIRLYADTGRPLILCFDGDSEKRYTQIHFEMNSHTFKGMIYAPYANEWEGVYVNAGSGSFYGSIYAGNKLNINNNGASFTFKDYVGKGASTGTGSKKYSTTKITLTNSSALSWD